MATSEKLTYLRLGDIPSLPKRMLAPIEGYENLPLVSLEEAVQPLVDIVPKVERNAILVKRNCQFPKDGLTPDESASIMLYTFESAPREHSLYMILNDTLRSAERNKLKPWFLYLRLILSALAHLPSKTCHVYRGVREDLRREYPKKSTFVWWTFSSCTRSIDILQNELFFGAIGSRTLFEIDCLTGKDIKNHSFIPSEEEILLMPAREFIVRAILNSGNDLYIIQLEEIESTITLIEIPRIKSIEQPSQSHPSFDIASNTRWHQNATTIITGLANPESMTIDKNSQIMYIVDSRNHRIVASRSDERKLHIVAGGHGEGSGMHQLNRPTDIVLDRDTNSMLICDSGNRRVMRWPIEIHNGKGETIISNIDCWGITMDSRGIVYVTDVSKHEVRRYTKLFDKSIVVAGGYGKGEGLHQLHRPYFICLDDQDAVYVSDCWNHRIMKWNSEASQGIVVAGGQGSGVKNTQLSYPRKILIDRKGIIYVTEQQNHRITRWLKGEKKSDIIAGGVGRGSERDQLNCPSAMSFDYANNMYVTDCNNHRVQCFSIE